MLTDEKTHSDDSNETDEPQDRHAKRRVHGADKNALQTAEREDTEFELQLRSTLA